MSIEVARWLLLAAAIVMGVRQAVLLLAFHAKADAIEEEKSQGARVLLTNDGGETFREMKWPE